MNKQKVIAFFDFDGTLTRSDSFWHFLRFANSTERFLVGAIFMFPILIGYKLKLISNSKAKQRVLKHFFEGLSQSDFNQKAQEFGKQIIPSILRDDMLTKLKWHQDQGHEICLVSASIVNYLKPWCMQMQVDCLATELDFSQGYFNGQYAKPNCWGPEKAKRINERFQLKNYDKVFAYGDSRGDKEMLELADKGVLV